MRNNLQPLYYAIIEHFKGDVEDCAQGVVETLSRDYTGYKLLNEKDVAEALATAKENGILVESSYTLDKKDQLVTAYRMSDFGNELVKKYLL